MKSYTKNQQYILKAKQTAALMLDMDYEIDTAYPWFVRHPFFNSVALVDSTGLFNITEEPQRYKLYKEELRKRIYASTSIEDVMLYMLRPNYINFLYLLNLHGIPDNLCGNILGDVWTSLENNDTQTAEMKKYMLRWLKASRRAAYLSKSDLDMLQTLPDVVTIYRGAQYNEPPKGFCWSVSYEVAEWFAKRFSNRNPVVYTATVPKSAVLFYTNALNEQEVVVDYTKLKKITQNSV